MSKEDRQTLEGLPFAASQVGADQDLTGLLLGSVDHGISTIIQAGIVPIAHATLLSWAERHRC